jgi:hypothetical protein
MSEVVENLDAPDLRASKAGFGSAILGAINFLHSDVRGC